MYFSNIEVCCIFLMTFLCPLIMVTRKMHNLGTDKPVPLKRNLQIKGHVEVKDSLVLAINSYGSVANMYSFRFICTVCLAVNKHKYTTDCEKG